MNTYVSHKQKCMEMLGNKLRVKKYGSDRFSQMTFR